MHGAQLVCAQDVMDAPLLTRHLKVDNYRSGSDDAPKNDVFINAPACPITGLHFLIGEGPTRFRRGSERIA